MPKELYSPQNVWHLAMSGTCTRRQLWSQCQGATYHVGEGLGCDGIDKVAAVNGLVCIPHPTLAGGIVRCNV